MSCRALGRVLWTQFHILRSSATTKEGHTHEDHHVRSWGAGVRDWYSIALATTLVQAGLRAEVSPHIQAEEWSKYVSIASGSAVAGLTRLTTAQFLNDIDGSVLVARIVRELRHIAAHLEIPLEDRGLLPIQTLCRGPLAEAVAYVRQGGAVMAARAPAHKDSLLHDLERGRRLEVEETLGYPARKGVELDVPLPTVDTCYRLLAGVNRYLQSNER
jgi:ketopantoate reductase